jgi:hypothetical protein
MTEQPLSGPATGLVITSTPAGRFVYWLDRKPVDLTDGNSHCVAYLDSLPFQEGTPLDPNEEHTSTEVATADSGLSTFDHQVFMLLARHQDPQGPDPTDTSTTSQQTTYPPMRLPMKPTTTRMPDVNAT